MTYYTAKLSAALVLLSVMTVACSEASPGLDPTEPPDTTPPPALSLTLAWSTYFGGSQFDEAREPVVLPGDRLLFSARAVSSGLPVTPGAIQTTFGGGPADTYLGILSADGRTLEAGTYFGGSDMERAAYGMEVAANGDIVFVSGTNSLNIPTTPGAYLEQFNSPEDGGYICRISGNLTTIRWCTYTLGWPRGGLTLAPNEDVIVVGRVLDGAPFTTTPGAYQTDKRGKDDAFVLRLSADGTQALFKTRLGGTGTALGEVAVSATVLNNAIFVSGISQSPDFPVTASAFQKSSTGPRDVFVARLSMDGSQLLYSTLLGGTGQDSPAHPDALTPAGDLIVAGETASPTIPGINGQLSGSADGLIAKFNTAGQTFDWVRFLGGSGVDRVIGRAVDSSGRIFIVGETGSSNFPVTTNALQRNHAGGRDGFIVIMDPSGTILYSTLFGGSGNDWIRGVAVAGPDTFYVLGATTSDDLPITPGVLQTSRGGSEDAFMAKFRITSSGN